MRRIETDGRPEFTVYEFPRQRVVNYDHLPDDPVSASLVQVKTITKKIVVLRFEYSCTEDESDGLRSRMTADVQRKMDALRDTGIVHQFAAAIRDEQDQRQMLDTKLKWANDARARMAAEIARCADKVARWRALAVSRRSPAPKLPG